MSTDYDKIKELVDEAEAMVDADSKSFEEDIQIDNKLLRDALKSQIPLQIKWERIFATVAEVYGQAVTYTEECESRAMEDIMTNRNRKWSLTEAKAIASAEPEYVAAKKLENRIKACKTEVEGYRSVIESRKYVLKDLVQSVVNSVENYII